MKSILCVLSLMFATATLSLASDAAWTTDWEGAKTRAKAENKPILIYLTGSDWCTWCMKMDKEILTQKEFMDFASANFVLMEADFPRKKELPAPLKEQNALLKKEYLNGGYPTMYVLDADGKKLSEDLGELKVGPAEFVEKLKELLAKIKK
jgi:thioredoxin-related protein